MGHERRSDHARRGRVARINLRLPDQLKSQVEQSADREGVSINAWLVRAVAAAVDRGQPGPQGEQRTPRSGQRYTGWGRCAAAAIAERR